jgi:hypothetical protein
MPYADPLAQKAAQQAWYQRNKELTNRRTREKRSSARTFITNYKLEHPTCTDCKIDYPPHILDFDHLGDKSFQIGGSPHGGRSIESIKLEIAKCEIVCSNCHRHRTFMRSINSPKRSKGEVELPL